MRPVLTAVAHALSRVTDEHHAKPPHGLLRYEWTLRPVHSLSEGSNTERSLRLRAVTGEVPSTERSLWLRSIRPATR